MSIDAFNDLLNSPIHEPEKEAVRYKKLGYVIEPGKVTLSFSRMNTLHSCPRKFLLKELNQKSGHTATIDTAFGSSFGAGVQELFNSGSLERCFLAALAEWDYEEGFISPFNNKKDKSFWACLATLEAFYNSEFQGLQADYKLAYLEGKPGIELFIYMSAGGSYNYQVHVDLVLQNRQTEAFVVAEIKTSGMVQQEANWGNADQTLGYYAILEYLTKIYNLPFEPRVIYITAQAGKYLNFEDNFGFQTFVYEKGPATSLDFARNVVLTIEQIELYIKHNYFPKRGSSCVTYNKVCEFYGMCDMETLQNPEESEHGNVYDSLSMEDVDFSFDVNDLIRKL